MASETTQRSKKRKDRSEESSSGRKVKKIQKTSSTDQNETEARIDDLQAQILDSQKNYNKINDLLDLAKKADSSRSRRKASLALCTIFSTFIVEDKIVLDESAIPQDNVVARWLLKKYNLYSAMLLDGLTKETELSSILLMQLVKQEVSNAPTNQIWTEGLYSKLIKRLLSTESGISLEDFATEHILPYKDARMYACKVISTLETPSTSAIDQILIFLPQITIPDKNSQPTSKPDISLSNSDSDPEATSTDPPGSALLASLPPSSKRKPPSHQSSTTFLSSAYISLLNRTLTTPQRKKILSLIPTHIAPTLPKPELLSDFLTDSFNDPHLSLSALSGIFHLITTRGLDYPAFYTKVYSLLTPTVLHSRQRSQFLELLVKFLNSTHLPAILVASFIKKISRLALHAPPAAIIAVVPWVYNCIRDHPVCAFMIHRSTPATARADLLGLDPFDPITTDPLHTNALRSSLWEIHSLSGTEGHYHPNVATIASILGKPFTKQYYKIDDFLGYGYEGMLEGELGRRLKRAPVVEFTVPKRVLVRDEDGGEGEDLLRKIFSF